MDTKEQEMEPCKNCSGKGTLYMPIDFRGPNCPSVVPCPICNREGVKELHKKMKELNGE